MRFNYYRKRVQYCDKAEIKAEEIARSLLSKGMSVLDVADVTGLNEKEVKMLK